LLTESVMLALTGGALGLAVAVSGIRFITWLLANGRDRFTLHETLDWQALGFTSGLALATGILFGFAPALQATRVELTSALKEARIGASRARSRVGLSQALVVSQIAISLLLVIGAGLFVRTLSNLESTQLGFNRENVLLFGLSPGQAGYKDAGTVRFYEDLRKRLGSVPGVRSVSLSDHALVSGGYSGTGVRVPGVASSSGREAGTAYLNIGPSFFTTMQIPILKGREIGERDTAGSPPVAVVNQTFAKKFFSDDNPVGRRFGLGGDGNKFTDLEIIGVAANARYQDLKRDIPPIVYIPYSRNGRILNRMIFEVKTAGDPLALANVVRHIVHDADPRVPVTGVTTQAAQIDQTIGQERTFAELCTCFAALALLISCVGLYGTMAYTVARRTSEIGIRMALGAERRRIVWMVLREVFTLSAVGLAIGLAAAWGTTRYVASFLFGTKPDDPLALSMSVAVLAMAATVAGYAPAWRASRIDPMAALRHE
jgi:macrolide transport system ATP-binding/permease protein